MSKFTDHVAAWKNCTLCPLHEGRKRVVLARGSLPCDVLFIGEAPGPSEDALGKPFIGPAGKLLDGLIERANPNGHRTAFTNLVACIPKDDDGDKFTDPPVACIKACSPRLYELIAMAKPRLVVFVGKLAAKHVITTVPVVEITHPAAILRADITQKGLMAQRVQVALEDAFEDL